MIRYYSPHRPVTPGSYPKMARVVNIHNFDAPEYIEEIDRCVWGYIDYAVALTPQDARQYELVFGGEICTNKSRKRSKS